MIVKLTNIPINKKLMDSFLTALNDHMHGRSTARRMDGDFSKVSVVEIKNGGFSKVSIVDTDNGAVHLVWRHGHQRLPDPIPEAEAEHEELTYECWLSLKMIEDVVVPMENKLSFAEQEWRQVGYKIETWSQKQRPDGVIETQTVTDERTYEWPEGITGA